MSYRSTDGQNWTARDGAKRQFEVNVAPDGTTSTILPDGQGGRTVDRAGTDGRGSQQNLAAPERAVAAPPAAPARPAVPGAAGSGEARPGAQPTDGSQLPGDTSSGAQPGVPRVIPNANGSIEYGTRTDGTNGQTITWRDPNNVARESLQQDGNGRWARTYTGSDGKPVTESVSQVRTYPDGSYSYQNDQGNRRVQENADALHLTWWKHRVSDGHRRKIRKDCTHRQRR
ncbi:MAG: hypothetical protein HYX67_09240 [Candidatus Melainabacteria bacterium]|nr:hypothetical protein [Candidatus Melainabacteria bacterium]